ncbi:TRAP transporter permease [Salibaculum griseiflavum]|uniref:C4-dicarboxylate ABC transporter permease n=1 Tax=Salibaculum griseiflavum TaxID=1914409 RepID=A0A2V1P4U7_9RHOB|nr:TRAP transporter fused permease subunit [Salibaculum griseiflavum]PWG17521.1 C4-dicarboxylate ABC transporter permease [Salibaculum griseiflavum]
MTTENQTDDVVLAEGVDEETVEANRRLFTGPAFILIASLSTVYAAFHMIALNGVSISDWTGIEVPLLPQFPLETWNFRIVHIAGAIVLGFLLFSARLFRDADRPATPLLSKAGFVLMVPLAVSAYTVLGFIQLVNSGTLPEMGGLTTWAAFPGSDLYDQELMWFGIPLLVATLGAIVLGWFENAPRDRFATSDIVLAACGVVVALYLVPIYSTAARNSVGTPFVPIGVAFAATAGTALIMELTRRVAGLALVIITGVFLLYTFTAHLLPGILAVQTPYSWQRFFGHVYSDAGILGPTTAVSSTYIILFIIFAAFLQASKVGDYFVNFAFAAAGRARGGPAKVAIFASGLMGMINGTSAGNVVATGSLTIPLMKKVGYHKRTAGAIEAAASTGGQIMPPIMGAGAFIMAEITGIPYTEIAIAAIIPAVLYFASIYFMVDLEAAKLGMRGMREDELPKLRAMVRRVFLFLPIIILIVALFMGYSVIRAGTLATVAAAVVSWLAPAEMRLTRLVFPSATGEQSLIRSLLLQAAIVGTMVALAYGFFAVIEVLDQWVVAVAGVLLVVGLGALAVLRRRDSDAGPKGDAEHSAMNLGSVLKAFELAGIMSIQIIAVCACAGIIVGVISLTGVGARFSSMLLEIAAASQLLALFFAMCIAILLGMGMPTTAAYAVAASVVAPGLVELGIPQLTAHFFVFYFAVVSAITPPVALASYAAAGVSGANPMATSVTSFKIGIAAFVVPFMFFYNSAILMDGTWFEVIRAGLTATVGVFLLSCGMQGWFLGSRIAWFLRLGLVVAALFMIEGGWFTDMIGVGSAVVVFLVQRFLHPSPDTGFDVRGAD